METNPAVDLDALAVRVSERPSFCVNCGANLKFQRNIIGEQMICTQNPKHALWFHERAGWELDELEVSS